MWVSNLGLSLDKPVLSVNHHETHFLNYLPMVVLFYLYGLFSLEITKVITGYHGLPQITTGYFYGKILDKYLKTYDNS